VLTLPEVADPALIVTGVPTCVPLPCGRPALVTSAEPQRVKVIVPAGAGWFGGVAMFATSCWAAPGATLLPPGVAVVVTFGGRCARIVERENFRRNKSGVKPERNQVATKRRDDKPHRVQRFASMNGDCAQSAGAQERYDQPSKNA